MSNTRMPSPNQISRALEQYREARDELLRADASAAEDERLWQDMIEGETDDVFRTLDSLAETALDAKAMADACRRRADELTARAKRLEGKRENMRSLLLSLMQTMEMRKLTRATYTAFISDRAHVIPTCKPEDLPRRFQRISIEADKTALGAALKAGEADVPATWSNPEPQVTIRVA